MACLGGLNILLLWAGIIGLASCQSGNVSAPIPPLTTTKSTSPSVPSQSVISSTPRTMTAAPVMSPDTKPAPTPPLTLPTPTSKSSVQPQNSSNMSDASPASTTPSSTTTSISKQIDSQTNTTQNQTSPPITTPSTTVATTTKDTTQAPPQCSYTVTAVKFGFRIDITSVTIGTYDININKEGRPETVKKYNVQHSNQDSSHETKHLEPCTEYEHNVAFIDGTGKETHCTRTENKTETTGMSKDDIKDVSCTPGYVCYQSEWDISSSLPTSNKIPAEPCRSDHKTFCVKPGYNDICSELTTTFTSGPCVNSFSLNKSISVDFLNPSEIHQTAPTKLPAKIEPTLPPNCKDLTIDYTCQEQQTKLNEPKKLSELEPFTDYSCIGQIKDNNVIIKKTTAIKVRIDCDLRIINTKTSATNTSIDLSWNTSSQNCQDVLPDLQKFSYDCRCWPAHYRQKLSITVNKHPPGGTCHIAGLEPFTNYRCEVHPTYNNKSVGQRDQVTQKTETGIPEDITILMVTAPEHNVIKVSCAHSKRFNGPGGKYRARLHAGSVILEKINGDKCEFEFKDLSYSTTYKVEVTAFNEKFESKPKIEDADTLYNDKALIGCLTFFIILITCAVVICVLRCRKSRSDVNEDMTLEPIYANERPPGWRHKEVR